jgi:hypothetical protein
MDSNPMDSTKGLDLWYQDEGTMHAVCLDFPWSLCAVSLPPEYKQDIFGNEGLRASSETKQVITNSYTERGGRRQ